ncbi:MAG: recombination protein RecR, partial [Candidatus Caldatribacteriota bacterium]
RIIKEEIKEVILAINPSVEGDATCSYFKMILPENILIDRIGFGVPIGGSLEYLDPLTISKALENRKRF